MAPPLTTPPAAHNGQPMYLTVPAELQRKIREFAYANGCELIEITASPTQAVRHELRPMTGRARPALTPDTLSDREMQVLHGMAQGNTNGDIGRALYLSEDTVKSHGRRLFQKLGVRDRAHAVALAYQTGLLGGDAP